ncbi:WXG100 family type VII secretion target [Kitasatospora sp. NPDC057223]|uniref:WXG100 family type VII secretion target n=1 Tax=Kitasatospora sp. NPDC057223 TaxID=3346055 RepID=UPI00362FE48F
MADGFRIDIDRMSAVSRQLGECGERMRSVTKRLEHMGDSKQMGTKSLDNACEDFEDEWHDGIGRMAKMAESLHKGLDTTLKSYADNESGTAKGFGAS